jgi:hypothetical protein
MFSHPINKLGLGVKTVSDQITDFSQQGLGITFEMSKVTIDSSGTGLFRRFIIIGFGLLVVTLAALAFSFFGVSFGTLDALGALGNAGVW